ncbi:unnamed protein product [Linum trigynum]|uniref:G protein gamma domain-containing protein n=2 Tax=Linum trigynum TaxID=586398 RepID=A0AAV2D216_9ROSI
MEMEDCSSITDEVDALQVEETRAGQGDQPEAASEVAVVTRPRSDAATANNNGYFGRHRMAAALSALQLQIHSTQEELDQLENIGGASAVCTEFMASVESIPDPLLPSTTGPTSESWDRWFRGAHHHNSRLRWI